MLVLRVGWPLIGWRCKLGMECEGGEKRFSVCGISVAILTEQNIDGL